LLDVFFVSLVRRDVVKKCRVFGTLSSFTHNTHLLCACRFRGVLLEESE
jgi:hypothetical protein